MLAKNRFLSQATIRSPSVPWVSTDDYRQHTSCVTEVERYEKREPNKKKGKVSPQQAWMDLITDSVESAPPTLRHYMTIMVNLDNVPRKEKQFRNFTANSLGLRGKSNADSIVAEIWKYLKGLKEAQMKARAESSPQPTPKTEEAAGSVDTSKATDTANDDSSVISSSDDEKKEEPPKAQVTKQHVSDGTKADAKSVKKAMKKVLKKTKGSYLSVKDLRKAVRVHLDMAKSDSDTLKKLVKENLEGSKKQTFVVQGKKISLQID